MIQRNVEGSRQNFNTTSVLRYSAILWVVVLLCVSGAQGVNNTQERKIKGKQSRNGPYVAQRVPGDLGSHIFMIRIQHMKVVRSLASHTGRLYPQECSWYSFSLGAKSTPGLWCGQKEICH